MQKLISGGQTGVDRAALDAGIALELPIGGWCPKDRRAMDGPIPTKYPLRETPSRNYSQRTEWNVRDSDGTLILIRGELSGGTRLTADLAENYVRPLFSVNLNTTLTSRAVQLWIIEKGIRVLNVAGPREQHAPGIHNRAFVFLLELLRGFTPRPGR